MKFDVKRRLETPFGVSLTVPHMAPSISDIITKFAGGQVLDIAQPVYYGDDVEQEVVYSQYDGDLSSIQTRYYDKERPLPKPEKVDPLKDEPIEVKEDKFENENAPSESK